MNHCHFCGNNIPDEVDTCAQANYACDGPRTKESNTPDTEWEGVEELGNIGKNIDAVREKLNEVIRGLNKIERLTVSRDTYWKERVEEAYKSGRKSFLKDITKINHSANGKQVSYVMFDEVGTIDWDKVKEAITPITNEDNLK